MPGPHVLAIAGGVGGAKLALGLARALPPEQLTVVVNTGDDETFHGLHVSPDVDSVTYALAGLTNVETGWGVADDSFRVLAALGQLGAETWFGLGDIDLATHIRRTDLLSRGWTLSAVTSELAARLGVAHAVVPMSDDPVRTIAVTADGELGFQDYFVWRACEPPISGVRFDGAETAQPSPGFRASLASADAIVFCPSNPIVSVGPVLSLPGVAAAIRNFRGPRIAVSPLVGGRALRGPAAKMMAELGEPVSSAGIAARYAGLCDALVIDTVDAGEAGAVEAHGMRAVVTSTVMQDDENKERLARELLRLIGSLIDGAA